MAWRGASFQTTTSTLSRRGADAQTYAFALQPIDFNYIDDQGLQARHLTVVTVHLQPTIPNAGRHALVTEFQFAGERKLVRSWPVAVGQPIQRAVFFFPNAPEQAATAVITR